MTRDEIIRLAIECQLATTGNRDGIYMDALERFASAVAQAEDYERRWYLARDELERATAMPTASEAARNIALEKRVDELQAELDALRSQEPVAWAVLGWATTQSESEAARWEHRGMQVTPLYAATKPGGEQ